MADIEIVILANSIKFRNHCVAGKIVGTQKWIRLVRDKQGTELGDSDVYVSNDYGKFTVKTLQKVFVTVLANAPLINQPENCIIDINSCWKQNYKIALNDVDSYLDYPESLWGDGDRISYKEIKNKQIAIKNSLYLVRIADLILYHKKYDGKPRRRAKFIYNNINYDLAVTDPKFDEIYNKRQNSDQAIICVSLGVPFEDFCYKIVASIFLV